MGFENGREANKKKTLFVISAINIYQGGPLSIYHDCLSAVRETKINERYKVVAFVHKKELFADYEDIATIIEIPKSRKNYVNRLYYEYVYFHKFSQRHKVSIWLSLQDITPRVLVDRQYTYCHNPIIFLKKDLSKIRYSITNVVWQYFYKYIYRINIKSADAVIVQQDWMRKEFLKLFPVKNVIVARPDIKADFSINDQSSNEVTKFIYAAYPRFFKNFENICEACNILDSKKKLDYEVWLTINGSENKYASDIYEKYKSNPHIKWLGLLSREDVFDCYNKVNAMIFPSRIETWGLPINEFKLTGKDMILVNKPYMYETLGSYEKCMFFDEDDCELLAEEMGSVITGGQNYQSQKERVVDEPYVAGWNELLTLIVKGK